MRAEVDRLGDPI